MQIAQDNATASPALGSALNEAASAARSPYSEYKVIRRNGAVVGFEPAKISVAMTKAFLAVNGSQGAASARIRELVAGLDPRLDAARPLRRRADGRGAQVRRAGGAGADRERALLQLRHGAPAPEHDSPGGAGRRGEPGGHGNALRRLLPAVHRARHCR